MNLTDSAIGAKVVILADMFQVMPWKGSRPLIGALQDRAELGLVPSGTYTITKITPLSKNEGCAKVYEITGPQ